jgi:hypothetical protein
MLASLTLLVAACGGDDDDDSADDEPTAEATTDSEDEDDEETEDADSTPEDEDEEEDEEQDDEEVDSDPDLDALVEDYESFTGYVKYDITELTGSDASGATSMAIYQKDGNRRIDFEDPTGTSIFITTTDAVYVCAESQCIKYPTDDPTAELGLGLFTGLLSAEAVADQFDLPEGVEIETFGQTVAGIDASCYRAAGDLEPEESGDETGEICFSEEGLLLSLDFVGAGESYSLIASEATTEVSDSDFEPPFEVIDLSELTQ